MTSAMVLASLTQIYPLAITFQYYEIAKFGRFLSRELHTFHPNKAVALIEF